MATHGSTQADRVFRFGAFELSERDAELRKNGVRIKLQEQPYRVLVELVANAGRVVSREELQQKLWPADTFVDFDVGLNTAIRKLRQALNDDADNPRYIETLARRGYRFVASVAAPPTTAQPVSTSEPAIESAVKSTVAAHPNQKHAAEGESWAESAPAAVAAEKLPEAVRQEPAGRSEHKWKWIAAGAFAAALILGFIIWSTRSPSSPVVEAITQLTDDEKGKSNLQTDGTRIYFNEEQSGPGVMQVSVKGGAVAAVPTTISPAAVAGIAPDGSSLLVLQGSFPVPRPVWELPLPAGEPRLMGNLDAHEASVTPDGRLLLSRVADLFITEKDGSNPRKIISLTKGHFGDTTMSPDGRRIVFTHYGDDTELFVANSDGSGVKPLAKSSEPGGFCCARWTADGRYIVFATRFPVPQQDLWYMPMNDGWLQHASQPKRLTAGPLSYWSPVPSRDGKTVFATGTTRRRALVRYDLVSHAFVPLFPGVSASDLTFSSDGQWVAYVSYPERCLWRARADGSDRLQLTFPPVAVYSPFISPDGKWIIYGSNEGQGSYMLSINGGTSQKVKNATAAGNLSPDGNFLVFNESTNSWQTPEVKLLDIRTGQLSLVPGGQLYPLWAAPGKFVAARRDMRVLQIYDVSAAQWSNFSKPEDGHVVSWAHSPDFKYFYYTTTGQDPRLFRVRMADMKSEVVVSLKNLDASLGGLGYRQLSVAPDESPVLAYEAGKQEIYALTISWP